MRNRKSVRLCSLMVLLLICASPSAVVGDTVIRAESVDLFPAGDFSDSQEWTLSTQAGFSSSAAEWTTAMVSDDHLSFTHARLDNFDSSTAWALSSSSNSNLSLGVPDGGYTWSKGPTIDLSGYDLSQVNDRELVNVSLLFAFAVPDSLQDDEIRFIVIWDNGQGQTQNLIRTFAHTPTAIDNMQGNPLRIYLDWKNWTWDELESLEVSIDYVSVGGIDDSEVRVDAVGMEVEYREPWYGFETAKAEHTSSMAMSPFIDLDLSVGSFQNLVIAPCGLELDIVSSAGSWISASQQRPWGQSWGRIHAFSDGNISIVVKGSDDGSNWSSNIVLNDEDLLPDYEYLKADIALLDGCLNNIRFSINDPTISIIGSVQGNVSDLVPQASELKVSLGTHLIATHTITQGSFSLIIPVGRYLPASGEDLDIGLGVRFQWSSDGNASSTVLSINQIVLSGGYVVEWDFDPICENPTSVSLVEDASGAVIPLRSTCSDDITPNDQLVVTAISQSPSLVEASIDDGRIIVRQLSEQSGATMIDVSVSDQRGNQWVSTFDVTVTSVDDAPTHSLLPDEVLVEVGQTHTIEFDVNDVDTPVNELTISTDVAWALINSYGDIELSPPAAGSFEVTVTIRDGSNEVEQSFTVLATSDPDLVIESVVIENSPDGSVTQGDIASITVWIRNSGQSTATLVGVRCYDDETLIDTAEPISMIDAGGLKSATCDWQVPITDGPISLRVYVDPTRDILEVSEDNNEYHTSIDVVAMPTSSGSGSQGNETGSGGLSSSTIWTFTGILVLFSIIALQLGPSRIRRLK